MRLVSVLLLLLLIIISSQPISIFADSKFNNFEHKDFYSKNPDQFPFSSPLEYETFNIVVGSYVKHFPVTGDKIEKFSNRPIGLEYNRNKHTFGFMNFTNSMGNNSNSFYYGHTFLDYIFITTGLTTGYGPINPPKRGFYILWGFRYRHLPLDIKIVCNPPLVKNSPITIGIQVAIAMKLKQQEN